MTCMEGLPWCSSPKRNWNAGLVGPDSRLLTPVVVGPTGVGKTAVAVALASLTPITVISADARQVYRGLDIGTAKPDRATRARVPHRGLDLIPPGERYSAGRFARDAAGWIAEARVGGPNRSMPATWPAGLAASMPSFSAGAASGRRAPSRWRCRQGTRSRGGN